MNLTQQLHRALQLAPDQPLTICGDRVRSARESADRVARLAGALRSLGVESGDRVALLATNSDRYHEAFFATWWIGAVVAPLNIRWSLAEIGLALRDAGPRVLLVDDAFAAHVPRLRQECPAVAEFVHCGDGTAPDGTTGYEELIAGSEPVEDLRVGGDELAALLYTGGTTGAPKGVMVSHQALTFSTLGTQVAGHSSIPGGLLLTCAPMFHIASIVSWLGQLTVGGTIVFLPGFGAAQVLDAVARHRITTLSLVPTMIQMLLDHPEASAHDLSSVRSLRYGASTMPAALLERAMAAFPQAGFTQGYGMTETAMVTQLGAEEHRAGGHLLRSAGRATPHCEIRILGPDGTELPRGEVGELVVRGASLMLGYWNRPEETAAVLRDGWMHTGDGASMDQDGYVFVADRIKDMIISGGENVYSAEVENALALHPAVAACAVVGLPDARWGERVHAVVVLRPGATAGEDDLRAHTRELIAGYKVPRSVEFTDALPLSGAGKVLKRELRAARLAQR
ncbi:acyl-CoA synthetase [Streptacidiphilus jiangxiensis]|uniref:Acyl-CoA synthetase (AMP-forming)/AMP-acid ligase II n=1 Tax=Streptacidiphilus jiangxiensis TaxID=235985 RepID=A0A1H7T3U9_STRJI|nr:long-chain fatty acid--CoA ligase [Streptacidiphilus jiangxiensis]SEL79582.1 Acyl-CoA synthetase (AMP-forming)/AMP-acid ligase II [Streptacidiphilus jiangxiensis]